MTHDGPVAQPDETQLAMMVMLMRIYDVQMALLTEVNEERANEIYAHHEKGESYTPPIYLPEVRMSEE